MIFDIVKPSMIVDINELQRKIMEKITLLLVGNNFQALYASTLEGIQQEINTEKGDDYCKDVPCSCNPSELLRLVPLMIVLLLTSVKPRAKVAWTNMGIQGCSQETFNQGPCDLLTSHNIPGASTAFGGFAM